MKFQKSLYSRAFAAKSGEESASLVRARSPVRVWSEAPKRPVGFDPAGRFIRGHTVPADRRTFRERQGYTFRRFGTVYYYEKTICYAGKGGKTEIEERQGAAEKKVRIFLNLFLCTEKS